MTHLFVVRTDTGVHLAAHARRTPGYVAKPSRVASLLVHRLAKLFAVERVEWLRP